MQPQLESPARTGADRSTADLCGRGKPAQRNTRANAGRALPLRAPAPILRFGLQVERTGCGRVARGCARLRGACGTALSPYLNSVRCSTVNSARCVLGAAPARVAACRAQGSEPSWEDGAGHALPGEGFPQPRSPAAFCMPRPALPCRAGPHGGPGAGNLGSVGVRVASCRTIRGLQVWPLLPGLRWGRLFWSCRPGATGPLGEGRAREDSVQFPPTPFLAGTGPRGQED